MKKYIFSLIISTLIFVGCNDTVYHGDNGTPTDISIDNGSETDTNTTTDTTTDIIDNNESNSTSDDKVILKKEIAEEENAKEWYVRLVVEDTTNNLRTSDTQLGQLETLDVNKHALQAISPFTSTYLDVAFVNPAGVDAGEYKSEFHISTKGTDEWEFTVKSSDSSAMLILSWRGLYVLESYTDTEGRVRYHEHRSRSNPLLNYMTLVDMTNGTEVDVLNNGFAMEYVIDMNGSNEKVFKWKIKDSSAAIQPKLTSYDKIVSQPLTQKEKLNKLQVQSLRKDAKATPTRLELKRLQSIDMRQPPRFKVLGK